MTTAIEHAWTGCSHDGQPFCATHDNPWPCNTECNHRWWDPTTDRCESCGVLFAAPTLDAPNTLRERLYNVLFSVLYPSSTATAIETTTDKALAVLRDDTTTALARVEALADAWEHRGEQALLASRTPGTNLGQHWDGMQIAAETKHYADELRAAIRGPQ